MELSKLHPKVRVHRNYERGGLIRAKALAPAEAAPSDPRFALRGLRSALEEQRRDAYV